MAAAAAAVLAGGRKRQRDHDPTAISVERSKATEDPVHPIHSYQPTVSWARSHAEWQALALFAQPIDSPLQAMRGNS
jgi:hypothetical protein